MNRIEKCFEFPVPAERAERQWREFERGTGGLPAGSYDAEFEPLGEDASRLSVIASDEDFALRRLERMVADFRVFLGAAP